MTTQRRKRANIVCRLEAVAKGAVAKRIEQPISNHAPYLKPCKRNYGIVLNQMFRDHRDDARHARLDSVDGRWRATDQVEWLIRKGDPVESGRLRVAATELHWNFPTDGYTGRQIRLVTSVRDDTPETLDFMFESRYRCVLITLRRTNVILDEREIESIEFDLSKVPPNHRVQRAGVGGVIYNKAIMKAAILVSDKVQFSLTCGDTVLIIKDLE